MERRNFIIGRSDFLADQLRLRDLRIWKRNLDESDGALRDQVERQIRKIEDRSWEME